MPSKETSAGDRPNGLERHDLIIAELNHRLRNIVGLIRGIMMQSRASASSFEDLTRIVDDRILALSRAHDQLMTEHAAASSLFNLIHIEAAAYPGLDAARLTYSGPHAVIAPDAVTTVVLVLHELLTNAAKYGALTDSAGSVAVTTAFDGNGDLSIEWKERDGPPVTPPTRQGFGSTVVLRSIIYDLHGEAKVTYDPAGLVARFVIPARYAHAAAGDAIAPANGEPITQRTIMPHAPRKVLVLEDNLIIAMDLEDTLRREGVEEVRLFAGAAEALAALGSETFDFAILDVNLRDGTSFEVADRHTELGIAFCFATGYGDERVFPERYRKHPRLSKPYTTAGIRGMLRQAGSAPRA